MLQGIYRIAGGLAKYTTLTGGLKLRFRMSSFCLNKSLVFSEKQGFTFGVVLGDADTADDETTWAEWADDRSGGGGGNTGGLTFRIDLEVIGQCSPSLTAASQVGPPKGRCMIVNTNTLQT